MSKVKFGDQINRSDTESFQDNAARLFQDIVGVINGGLDIPNNMIGVVMTVIFDSIDTDITISHKLGYRPDNFVVLKTTAAADVYMPSDNSTAYDIILRANALATVKLWIF